MKTLLVVPVVALVAACATAPELSAQRPAASKARQAYVDCSMQAAVQMVGNRQEPARDLARTAVGQCQAQLVALQDAVEGDNAGNRFNRVFAAEYAKKVREKALEDVAYLVTQGRRE